MKRRIVRFFLSILAGYLAWQLFLRAAVVTGVLTNAGSFWLFPIGDQQTIQWSSGVQAFFGEVWLGISQSDYLVVRGTSTQIPVQITAEGTHSDIAVQVESRGLSPVVLSPTVVLPLIATSGTSLLPSANVLRLEVACGTSAGTLQLLALAQSAGTFVASSTIIDNVGYGISGC